MKSSDSVIIVVVVSYRKSRTFSVSIYYYSAQSIYDSTIIPSSLTSTLTIIRALSPVGSLSLVIPRFSSDSTSTSISTSTGVVSE